MDRGVDWNEMAEAAYAIGHGALFIGTNIDPSFPTERGLAPGNGAILKALEATTGIAPIIVGKPEPYLFLRALDRIGTSPGDTLAVGDRLETDILGGRRAGMKTALMLTGVTSLKALEGSDIRPDYVFNHLEELIERL
jgi:4-nitrophenyl phosphatase